MPDPAKLQIFIASDHGGFDLKQKILEHFNSYNIIDLGPADDDRVDYPDFADLVTSKIESENQFGILVCGSGQGMAIKANRSKHIRAALCWNQEVAELSRGHNNANVLCMGSRVLDHSLALKIVETFFTTKFEGGRHTARVEKLSH